MISLLQANYYSVFSQKQVREIILNKFDEEVGEGKPKILR
jgi:hypothetical protein